MAPIHRSSLPLLVSVLLLVATVPLAADELCAVVDVDRIGHNALVALATTPGVEHTVELGDRLLVCGSWDVEQRLRRLARLLAVHRDVRFAAVYVVTGRDAGEVEHFGGRILMGGSRLVVAEVADFALDHLQSSEAALELRPLPGDGRLVRQLANQPGQGRREVDPAVQALVDEVDSSRWFADVVTLAAMDRTNGGGATARNWLAAELGELPGVTVTTASFSGGYNVIATLPGTTRPDDWYIVGVHYDAVYPQAGADDNASGAAGVLELARILTAHPPEGTVLFINYGAEEDGLVGSYDHSADLVASGDASKVKAMLDMDMIGYTSDASLDCLLESEGVGLPLHSVFSAAATTYTDLVIHLAYYAWGSDHEPYLTADTPMPALLTIEDDWDSNPYYHRPTDVPAHVSQALGGEILRMNVAAMAVLAGAAGDALFADGFEGGTTGSWSSAAP